MELVEFPWAGARSSDSGEASDSKGSMDDDELSLTAHDIQKTEDVLCQDTFKK
ncbi:hypothetical protein Pmar_PMAR021611 [Perkinsus marinus ATCC 50983]|uniref:Uncharacterized protein n=1 Tax=Perkinsus marinus (strain ATCC 50983 / TXsc) TaxID=423536 RepID=C5KUL2_PERM5|nr:hypothetical protein Pmar_PMAR021611 [Perkinsus marinus ATCC 50983]EER11830.1 hypothetical protein Pmar_PMAR021611 [Perkinsus marinus ATCC 50983]|eukprot:XP_002780035.1 hypothetical protein Pmar_PMAR021611 [Perkinsus marinus ATCC 50983]